MPSNFFFFCTGVREQSKGRVQALPNSTYHFSPVPHYGHTPSMLHFSQSPIVLEPWKGRQAQTGLPGTCSSHGIISRGVFHFYFLQSFVKTTRFNGNSSVVRFKTLGLNGQMCRGLLD